MRLWEDRFTRDLRRLQLVWRLISHEARTDTISRVTGLTAHQVRTLYKAYAAKGFCKARRHRGSAPRLVDYFLSSLSRQAEAAAVGSWCALMGLIRPGDVSAVWRSGNGIHQVEDLCTVFELYRGLLPESQRSQLSIEHVILLVKSLSNGEELLLESCERCSADMIIENSVASPRVCAFCRRKPEQALPRKIPGVSTLSPQFLP